VVEFVVWSVTHRGSVGEGIRTHPLASNSSDRTPLVISSGRLDGDRQPRRTGFGEGHGQRVKPATTYGWLIHPVQHGVAGPCEDGPADRRQDYCFVNFRSDVSTVSSLSTPNDPGTSRARMPARVLSPSVSTTPSSMILPFFTMMWIG
jgi:hypothetical protein